MEEIIVKENGNRSMTVRDALMPVFRQRRIAKLVFSGILLGSILSIFVLPRKFEAEMKILVNRDRVDAAVTPNPDSPVAPVPKSAITEEDLNSEVELLKSRDLLEEVVRAAGLEEEPNSRWARTLQQMGDRLRRTPESPETRLARAVQGLEECLVVEPLKKTSLIRVAYASRDPQRSARVLRTLATLYQEKHAAVHRPAGTFQFFEREAARYKDELATAEARLTEFNSREGLVAAPVQKQLVLEQLSQFEAETQQMRANAAQARERERSLRAQSSEIPERQTTQIRKIDNRELLAQLESTLLSLELKHSEMEMKYAPEYPPVREVERQIDQALQAITRAEQTPAQEVVTDRVPAQDWMATELAKAEADRAAEEVQAAAAERVVRHYQEAARRLSDKGTAQDDLLRNVKTAEDNYLLYLRKREEARISDALDEKRIVNVSIAEEATVPALPTLHLGWVLIGGFFAAGLMSVGTAYAVDRLDPSFRTPEELGRVLEVPVMASVPADENR